MDIIAPEDLTSYLRQPDADVDQIVDLANGVVGDLIGPVDPVPTRVFAITLEVAARAYRNPGGYQSETIDDYTYRLPTETRNAGVYLTAAEKSELLGLSGLTVSGVYTVPLGGPDVF